VTLRSVAKWFGLTHPAPELHTQTASQAPVDSVRVNFPESIRSEFPDEFPLAWRATEEVLAAIHGHDLSALAARSPGLRNYDWTAYLRCSVARMVRVARALPAGASLRVLDIGSYFGNFALMCQLRGYRVDAIDSYSAYGAAFAPCVLQMQRAGVSVLDFAAVGTGLEAVDDGSYDAVLCLGVIEHIAHTPRPLLRAVERVLAPGGCVIIDTPNIAYLYNRHKLLRGKTIMPPIEVQFDCDPPFEGHHREYTIDELAWMLEHTKFTSIVVETFNYSFYALDELAGEALSLHREMLIDPSKRELLFARAQKRGIEA
jgi:2-polyprenyl-3-methyl-5-hydroxy-6-metoxy-1,4-benzoquinol methylase